MRAFLRGVFRRALRIFFRRIEVEGLDRVPVEGPVLFVANHPNALVDPLLLLCFAPRRVAFLAKAPLFRMPLVGLFVRAFGSIPVYRRQDSGSELARNRETFDAAGRLLAAGGALALFPEGASHDEPALLPMKTGAARVALGTAGRIGASIAVVPVGLYYTFKQRFRSSVLVLLGEAIAVEARPLEPDGDPPRAAVRGLTEEIGGALSRLAVQAETRKALDLVRRAERIYAAGGPAADGSALADELERRRRFAAGYRALRERDPARLDRLSQRIERFEAERRAAGLSLAHLAPEGLTPQALAALLWRNLAALALLPVAAAGVLVHFVPYRLIGWLARRIAREDEDVLATAKVGLSVVAFPLLWIAGAVAAWRLLGGWAGVLVLAALPASAWAAMRAAESLDELVGRARALLHLATSSYALKRLLAQRRALRLEMEGLSRELEA